MFSNNIPTNLQEKHDISSHQMQTPMKGQHTTWVGQKIDSVATRRRNQKVWTKRSCRTFPRFRQTRKISMGLEVWMKSKWCLPAWTKAKKLEIVHTLSDHFGFATNPEKNKRRNLTKIWNGQTVSNLNVFPKNSIGVIGMLYHPVLFQRWQTVSVVASSLRVHGVLKRCDQKILFFFFNLTTGARAAR